VNGFVTEALLREVERAQATVILLGSHGHRRMTEILIGGVTGEVLHRAPCSVLVARPPQAAARFPRAIVVGNDDSAQANVAVQVAEHLAERFRAPLSIVKATGPDHPVHALVRASAEADLVVVGSRGLHGLKALGSVSERVAHEALCSVLVVRAPSG
jgi:nucleotide-binding universal stress UspA family protein